MPVRGIEPVYAQYEEDALPGNLRRERADTASDG